MINAATKHFVIIFVVFGSFFSANAISYPAGYSPTKTEKLLQPLLQEKGLKLGAPIFVRIFKQSAELEVWIKGADNKWQLFANYPICYYSGLLGPKLQEGDRQSPEGFYKVTAGRMNPNSQFHLSFNLGFPNKYDRSHKRTGSYLMVHGNCVSIGCYAMTNAKIEEIFTLARASFKKGHRSFPVHVFPFRMTEKNMQLFKHSKWIGFWQNLKQGYDFFEKQKAVPKISVAVKRYVFSSLR